MENSKRLYDVTVTKGDPQYVVNMVILQYGITKDDFLNLLGEKSIIPKGLVFDKPNVNQFGDVNNVYRIEVNRHWKETINYSF